MKELKTKADALGAKNFITKEGEILQYENGAYLIEIDEFIKLKDGKIQYKPIEKYKGFDIKFCKNGCYNFSIFMGTKNLEDNITSIKKAKEICDDFSKKESKHIMLFEQFVTKINETGEWDDNDTDCQSMVEHMQTLIDLLISLTNDKVSLSEIRGFDKYQGCYANVTILDKRYKIWFGENENTLWIENFIIDNTSDDENSAGYLGTVASIAEVINEL